MFGCKTLRPPMDNQALEHGANGDDLARLWQDCTLHRLLICQTSEQSTENIFDIDPEVG